MSKKLVQLAQIDYMTLHLQGRSEHKSMFIYMYSYYLQNYSKGASVPARQSRHRTLVIGFEPPAFG